jgi:hypothetical protein
MAEVAFTFTTIIQTIPMGTVPEAWTQALNPAQPVIPANAGTQQLNPSGENGDLGPRFRGDDSFILTR